MMTPADEAALRQVAAKLFGHSVDKLPSWFGVSDTAKALREAFALGRASGWQAGALQQLRHCVDVGMAAATLVPYSDDQRASVSTCGICGSATCEGTHMATDVPIIGASVSGERDGEVVAEYVVTDEGEFIARKPTDRNAGRGAALTVEQFAKALSAAFYKMHQEREPVTFYTMSLAVEAALKGGA